MINFIATVLLLFLIEGSAYAQSNVSISGWVDLGLVHVSGSATNIGPGGISLVGIHGSEELGNGWKTDFVLDQSFDAATGVPIVSSNVWDAALYVGLEGPVGHLRLGRWYTAADSVAFMADAFEARTVASVSRGANGEPDWTTVNSAYVRYDTALYYESPSVAGLVFNAAYEVPAYQLPATVVPYFSGSVHRSSASLEYTNDNLYLGIGSEIDDIASRFVTVALNYQLGKAKLIAGYVHGRNLGVDADSLQLGAQYQMTPNGSLRVAFANLGAEIEKLSRKKLGLGYWYDFSKRTQLYTDCARVLGTDGQSNGQLDLGIKHIF